MTPIEKHILNFVFNREKKGVINNFKYIHDRGSRDFDGSFEDFMENSLAAYLSLCEDGFFEKKQVEDEYMPRIFLTDKAKEYLQNE
ncbi:MAG: hypothetical protein MUE30_04345 [Spirosomaceae bacterium]|jgi:hypothetical protein|nr:hypothetical protein [Spirosomataceae bacterium]